MSDFDYEPDDINEWIGEELEFFEPTQPCTPVNVGMCMRDEYYVPGKRNVIEMPLAGGTVYFLEVR